MTKANLSASDNDDMLPEYDFRGGVRGKHFEAYRSGHSVTVLDEDGVEESLRRSREMDENPAMSLTEEEFSASFEKYRTR